jgi:Putative polyhydroxyalkanoic acid system protein (PHA_gran_rgn)
VRISVSHNRTKEEAVQTVDRTIDDLFKEAGALPVKLTVEHRSWQGSTMTFALTAKMGFMSTPIKGTVEVTDRDVIVDADLGMLGRFVNDKTAQQVLGSRIKGLLK